jgi:hypothetical protein
MRYLIFILLITACGQVDDDPAADDPTTETTTEGGEPIVEGDGPTDTIAEGEAKPAAEGEPEAEIVEEFTQWADPVTDRLWLMGDLVDASNAICGAGYEVPDYFDLVEANANGLAAELASRSLDSQAWAKNINNGVVESYRDIADPSQWTNSLTGARLWCVEEN